MPKQHAGKSVNWRRDPEVRVRLEQVERLQWRRLPNTEIARQLKVDETTIRRDKDRLQELWLERTAASQDEHRAAVVASLEDNERLALEAYEWDKQAEEAVLYGSTVEINGQSRVVYRDAKMSAQFRGGKAQALAERRQAAMAKAKVLGIVVDKQEQVGEMLVRVVERERPSDG